MQTERNALVIDAYNANPTSMQAAINAFHGNCYILGAMRELGEYNHLDPKILVNNLLEQAEGVPIYVLTAFPTTDSITNERTDKWNAALFALCDEKGLHYVDVSTTLKANDGTLSENYQDEQALYQTVCELILTHVAD